jgi:2,5-dioxopentanoate dehydrogenase
MGEIRGVSIVAGQAGSPQGERFTGFDPNKGKALVQGYHAATDEEIDRACELAWEAFEAMRKISAEARAAALEGIADRLTELGKALVEVVTSETGLTTTRVISERERAAGVLRSFAEVVRDGSWVRACIEPGDARRKPNPKPDLRRMLVPLGPVAVFGASNFPLAYSTAGGDTASALAAGCPVIVKGHPMHPGTGELVAWAVTEAVKAAGLPGGAFSFLHSGGKREREVGARLVSDARVRAVGFTGSFAGGAALDRLARERDEPIPVFAEMGSTNPIFVLKHALEKKGDLIADRVASSVINASGQMCTCPGLVFVLRGEHADVFERALVSKFNGVDAGRMLGPRILDGFVAGVNRLVSIEGVELRSGSVSTGWTDGAVAASPALLKTTGKVFLSEGALIEEVFGPSTVLVVCADEDELLACSRVLPGSLSGTMFVGSYDGALLAALEPILAGRVGRVVFNGVPTGVEVNAAMVHGGPWPATTWANSTAQGDLAMERWCRLVCYQNAPEVALPEGLRNANPLGITRKVAGERTNEPVGAATA